MASRKVWLARNVEDVDVTGVGDGDSLVWDAGTSKWIPGAGGVGAGIDTVQENGSEKINDADTINFVDSGNVTITVTDEGSGLAQVVISGAATEIPDIAIQKDDIEVVAAVTILNFEGRDIVSVTDEGAGKATVVVSGGANVIEELANVLITDIQDGEVLSWDADNNRWYNRSIFVAENLYLHDETSTIDSDYKQLLASPPDEPEEEDTVGITAASGLYLIDSYLTEVAFGQTIIPGGSWHFFMYAKVNNASNVSTITASVYEYTSVGGENLLFSVTTPDINATSTTLYEIDTVQPDLAVATDSRLLVKFFAQTTRVVDTNITLVHGGTTNYTHIHTPFELAAETEIEYLDDLTDVNAPSPNDGDVLTYDDGAGEWISSAPSSGGHTITWSGGDMPQRTKLMFLPGNHTAEAIGPPTGTSNWIYAFDRPDLDATVITISGGFLGLIDTPDSYGISPYQVVRVNGDNSGLEFADMNPHTYIYEAFTVASGTSKFTLANSVISFNATNVFWNGVAQAHSHLENTSDVIETDFVVQPGDEFFVVYPKQGAVVDVVDTFLELVDTPSNYSGDAGKVVVVNPGETALEFADPATVGTLTWLGLTDTPDSYTNFDQAIVMVSGTNLNYLRGNELGFPIADLRKLTNVHTRDCEFINQPAWSGWGWQSTAGTTMTLSTCSGWMHHTSTTEGLYSYGLDLPSHLVAFPAVGNTAKFWTGWTPAHKGNWAVAMKCSVNNGRHSGDSIQLTVSTFQPTAASIDPSHGVTLKLKDNGVNYDITTYYHNGGSATNTITTTTSWGTHVYLALASMSDGMVHVYYSTDGLGWNWLGWHNASTVWSTGGIGAVWIGFNDATGATSTVSTGIVDWIRFIEGSVNLWEMTRGR